MAAASLAEGLVGHNDLLTTKNIHSRGCMSLLVKWSGANYLIKPGIIPRGYGLAWGDEQLSRAKRSRLSQRVRRTSSSSITK